jgi:hypothetical protein
MSDGKNVVSFKTGGSEEEEQEREKKALELYDKHLARMKEEHVEKLLEVLDQTKSRVQDGDLNSLMLLGYNPKTGAFLNCAMFSTVDMKTETMMAHSAALMTLNREVLDMCEMGTRMMPDGTHVGMSPMEALSKIMDSEELEEIDE